MKENTELIFGNTLLQQKLNRCEKDKEDHKIAGQLTENLFETANAMIITLDVEATITSFNRYAQQLTGYKKKEVIGRNWFDIFALRGDIENKSDDFRPKKQGVPDASQVERSIILKNGSIRLISWRNNNIRDSADNISGTLIVGIDITEHRLAQVSLQKNKKLLQSFLKVIDNSSLALLLIDKNYCVRDMNDTGIAWFGDQRGQICYESIAGRDQPCSYCKLNSVIEEGKTVNYKSYPSNNRFFDTVALPIENQDGRVSKLEIIRDTTEQTMALVKIKKLSCTLEEQTWELEQKNDQLLHKKKEIEKRNIALKVLVGQQQETREEIEMQMATCLKKLVYPYLNILQENVKGNQAKEYIDIIVAHLDTMATSFIKKLNNPIWQLTQREILVADLVRQGKSTKEIGRLLNISPRTAERYRNTIRKKIGLTKKKISLRAYLNSSLEKLE